MKKRGPSTLDLLEEAVHLLRTASPFALGWYYLGTLPFVLVLLYFWTDMSWSADALRDCAVNAAGVSLVFVWMKFCQAMCARRLAAQLKLEVAPRTSSRSMLRMALQQTIIQPSKLFVLPVAFILTIPFAWVCAFYENASAFGEAKNLRALWSKSWKQAKLWPRQNHLALSIFVLWCFIVGTNVLLLVLIAPHLLKLFTGMENVFTRSGVHALNSTVLAVVASLTYLCCDPLLKAIYVLRCFYGESLQSGEDLQVELRRLRQTPAVVLSVVMLFFCMPIFGKTAAASPPVVVSTEELDRSITETITKSEFSWRMPREATDEKPAESSPNVVTRFLKRIFHTLAKWWDSFVNWLDRLGSQPSMPAPTPNAGAGIFSRGVLQVCLVILCLALVALLGVKIRERFLEARQRPRASSPIQHVDLTEESVTADQLPEDEWLRLAGEFVGKGEWRLALRALFLAGLAHLSKREMIALARHKSNRDYQIELRRRAPARPALHDAFARNLGEIERAWYGRHAVDPRMVEDFRVNLEVIRTA
jgi:hypothetical protein